VHRKDVKVAIVAIQENKLNEENRTLNFKMRPEQKVAVDLTASYFRNNPRTAESKTPHFLWNAKMRFGKTFTAYQLAKEMNWKKVLVLTFKPAVESAWGRIFKVILIFRAGSSFLQADYHMKQQIRRNHLSASAHFRIIWGAIVKQVGSKPRTSGCMLHIGIA